MEEVQEIWFYLGDFLLIVVLIVCTLTASEGDPPHGRSIFTHIRWVRKCVQGAWAGGELGGKGAVWAGISSNSIKRVMGNTCGKSYAQNELSLIQQSRMVFSVTKGFCERRREGNKSQCFKNQGHEHDRIMFNDFGVGQQLWCQLDWAVVPRNLSRSSSGLFWG